MIIYSQRLQNKLWDIHVYAQTNGYNTEIISSFQRVEPKCSKVVYWVSMLTCTSNYQMFPQVKDISCKTRKTSPKFIWNRKCPYLLQNQSLGYSSFGDCCYSRIVFKHNTFKMIQPFLYMHTSCSLNILLLPNHGTFRSRLNDREKFPHFFFVYWFSFCHAQCVCETPYPYHGHLGSVGQGHKVVKIGVTLKVYAYQLWTVYPVQTKSYMQY